MKLGTETGSLMNHLYSRQTIGQPEPTVGMGATILGWTDRHAGTIVKVETINGSVFVTVQEDTAKRVDKNGMSECQDYEFAANPNGAKTIFRRAKNGRWDTVCFNTTTKRWNKLEGNGLTIDRRDHYYDFSF